MLVLALVLLFLGLGLFVAEAHMPTYGALGVAGIASLAAGIVLAVMASGGGLALALGLTLPIAAAAVAVGAIAMRRVLIAGRLRAGGGAEGLVGRVGVVRRPLDPLGHVLVDGELWRARPSWVEEDEAPPVEGEPVVVDRVHGLTLSVRRAEAWEVDP
jgi:membrane-bound ClpP family serine protease